MSGIVDSLFGSGGGSKASNTLAGATRRSIAPINRATTNARKMQILTSGGFRTGRKNGKLRVSSTGERLGLVNNLASTFSESAEGLGALSDFDLMGIGLPDFPEFGDFPEFPGNIFDSARANLEDTRRQVTGDLRDNLARRRVAGSSFASDALARADREFERQSLEIDSEEAAQRVNFDLKEDQRRRDHAVAGADFAFNTSIQNRDDLLREITVKSELIKQQGALASQAVQTILDNLNLEAEVALQLQGMSNGAIAALAQAQAANVAALGERTAQIQFAGRQQVGENVANLVEAGVAASGGGTGGGGTGGGARTVTGINDEFVGFVPPRRVS